MVISTLLKIQFQLSVLILFNFCTAFDPIVYSLFFGKLFSLRFQDNLSLFVNAFFISDLLHSYDFRYYLDGSDSHIYFSSIDLSPEFNIHIPNTN